MKKAIILVLDKKLVLCGAAALFIALAAAVWSCGRFYKSLVHVFADPSNGIIVIDPGHGGIDGGTSWGGMLEKDINLAVSQRLKKHLVLRGFTVIMTREEDVSLEGLSSTGGSRHWRDLNARREIINRSNAQLFLSIHVNCHLKNLQADGSIVFYQDRYIQNKTLAYCIQRPLNSMLVNGRKRTVHGPQKGNYFLLSHADIPGVIVETAFISNAEERSLLAGDEFQEALAEGIVKGVECYLKEKGGV